MLNFFCPVLLGPSGWLGGSGAVGALGAAVAARGEAIAGRAPNGVACALTRATRSGSTIFVRGESSSSSSGLLGATAG